MWLNKIKNKKLQMFLIGLVVLVSSLMLTAALGIIISVDKPMSELIKDTNAPTLYAIVPGVNDLDRQALNAKKVFEKNAEVKKVAIAERVKVIRSKIMDNNKEIKLSTKFFMTYKDGEFGSLKFLKGGSSLQDGQCFITSIIAQTYKLSLGDYITIENPDSKTKLKITGIYSDAYSVSSFMDVDRFYVSKNQLQSIYGIPVKLVTVYARDGGSCDNIVKYYRKNTNIQIPISLVDINRAKISAEIMNEIIGAFVCAFAIIILLVSAVVIRASILDSIAKEYKTIGVYKAIGYSANTIMNIYMKAYSFIVIIFAVIGSFLASFFINAMLSSNFKVYGEKFNTFEVVPIIVTLAFVIILMLSSIYGVIKRTKNISPVEVFRIGMPVNNKKGTTLKIIETKFTPISQALRKIFYYKKLSIILFLVLFVCSYVVAFSVINYSDLSKLSEKTSFWFGLDNAQYRIRIKNTKKTPDILEWIKKNDKIKNYVDGTFQYAKIVISKDELDGEGSLISEVYDTYDNAIKEEVVEGRNPKNENEIAVSKKVMEKTHKKLGDYIKVYISGEEKNLLIVGDYQSMMYMGMNVRVLKSTVKSADKSYVSDAISFNLKNSKDYDSFKKILKNRFGSAIDVEKSIESFSSMLSGSLVPMKAALTPFMIMIVVVGAINVFSIILLMNINSRREFCVYKAIGYSTPDLIKGNLFYVLILAVIASIICIPVFSITFCKIMNLIMSTFGIYNYPADIKPELLAVGLIASIFVYVLCTLISSLSIGKVRVQELNEE
ncbi:ABC transporter permease [Clostridium hydrogenum]|uniref:ABC transporter permease n=1 Tax=Clostridium hydrogenum TaxID=2855764 RepID=UPI001F487662|nr:ABC transporter permease [Clostridium hydrogenum]